MFCPTIISLEPVVLKFYSSQKLPGMLIKYWFLGPSRNEGGEGEQGMYIAELKGFRSWLTDLPLKNLRVSSQIRYSNYLNNIYLISPVTHKNMPAFKILRRWGQRRWAEWWHLFKAHFTCCFIIAWMVVWSVPSQQGWAMSSVGKWTQDGLPCFMLVPLS